MKRLKKLFAVLAVFCLGFTALDAALPDNIVLFEGESRRLSVNPALVTPTSRKVSISVDAGDYALTADTAGTYDIKLKLFGFLPYKSVSVDVLEKAALQPGGQTVGIKIYAKGLICIGFSDLETENGLVPSPAKSAGLADGDVIVAINGSPTTTAEAFMEAVAQCVAATLTVQRGDAVFTTDLVPCRLADGSKKIGAWVRDSIAGVGTLTFYDRDTGWFGALGHPISDSDTGVPFPVAKGELAPCEVVEIAKGEKGSPGEVVGRFTADGPLATVETNTPCGIFGKMKDGANAPATEEISVGWAEDVHTGEAYILSDLLTGTPTPYRVEIQNVFTAAETGKDMLLKVTDETLLAQTGGIIQGMSGSPIVQDGKLIGAVTHVFINAPSRGYGIFIENMLAEAEVK